MNTVQGDLCLVCLEEGYGSGSVGQWVTFIKGNYDANNLDAVCGGDDDNRNSVHKRDKILRSDLSIFAPGQSIGSRFA